MEIWEPDLVNESYIDDPELTDSFVADQPVTFEVIETGTIRRAKRLVSSDGYSYTVKNSTAKTINWRCSVRNKSVWCKATVMQRGDIFVRCGTAHVHPSDPGITKKTKIKVDVLKEGLTDVYKSAGNIVEQHMRSHLQPGDFNLPKPDNLARAVNRHRQNQRPPEPNDLHFEIDRDFLQIDQFLIGDIKVDSARHIMLASPT